MKRITLLALVFTLLIGLSNTCSANLIIVNTPTGTTVCTPLGNSGTIVCN